jgi:hypothetical protein
MLNNLNDAEFKIIANKLMTTAVEHCDRNHLNKKIVLDINNEGAFFIKASDGAMFIADQNGNIRTILPKAAQITSSQNTSTRIAQEPDEKSSLLEKTKNNKNKQLSSNSPQASSDQLSTSGTKKEVILPKTSQLLNQSGLFATNNKAARQETVEKTKKGVPVPLSANLFYKETWPNLIEQLQTQVPEIFTNRLDFLISQNKKKLNLAFFVPSTSSQNLLSSYSNLKQFANALSFVFSEEIDKVDVLDNQIVITSKITLQARELSLFLDEIKDSFGKKESMNRKEIS